MLTRLEGQIDGMLFEIKVAGGLPEFEEALRRIQSGEFGSCTSCSKPIGDLRLHAIPWARYCIDCQELEEKGLLG